jgi:PPOX class probable F420-dependent enzyme
MAQDIPAEKQTLIDELLSQPVLARLATANPANGQPHVTPVWFLWDGESIWISAFISTRKGRYATRNPRISVLIEPKDPDGQNLEAVLMEGVAEVLSAPPELMKEMSLKLYERYMGAEGVQAAEPQSWAVDPENRLIRLKPEKIYSW